MEQFSVKVIEIATRRLVVSTTDQSSSSVDSAYLAWSSAYPPRQYRVIITR